MPAQHFLVQLRQFTRDRDGPAGKRCFKIAQRVHDAVRAFEEDERGLQFREVIEQPLPLARLLRHEARKQEAVCGQARQRKPRQHGGGAGAAVTGMPCSAASFTSR